MTREELEKQISDFLWDSCIESEYLKCAFSDDNFRNRFAGIIATKIEQHTAELRKENESLRKATEIYVTPEREYEARLMAILNNIQFVLNDDSKDYEEATEDIRNIVRSKLESEFKIGWDDIVLTITEYEDLRSENERLRDVLSAIKDANEGNITPIVEVMYKYRLAPKNADTLEPDELGRAIISNALRN